MKIKAIVPWFGAKRTLAPKIVQELGPHTQYFEPFCGSMAVLCAKTPSQKETVNDLHGGLICLARVIADEQCCERLYERLHRTLFCESLLKDAQSYIEATPVPWPGGDDSNGEQPGRRRADESMLEYAYWYFIGCWMARNGVAGTDRQLYQIAVRWTKNGGSPTVRWRNGIESMPAWHVRLANVVIMRRDAFNIVDRFEDVKGTAIYIDPPYAPESRTGYFSGSGESSRYLHELTHEDLPLIGKHDQHAQLAGVLRTYKHARIVVSYYDCARVRSLYAGWTFVKHTRTKNLGYATDGDRTRYVDNAPEILIINGPSHMEAAA